MGVGRTVNAKFRLAYNLSYFPMVGDADLTGLTQKLIDEGVTPDISRLQFHTNVATEFVPREGVGELLGMPVRFGIVLGMHAGAVRTVDDGTLLGILDSTSNTCPDSSTMNSSSEQALFCKTQTEWHAASGLILASDFYFDNQMSVRCGLKQVTYVETMTSTVLEMKNTFMGTAAIYKHW